MRQVQKPLVEQLNILTIEISYLLTRFTGIRISLDVGVLYALYIASILKDFSLLEGLVRVDFLRAELQELSNRGGISCVLYEEYV